LELKVRLDQLDIQVLKVRQVLKELKETLVFRELKETSVLLGHKV
jgi:hypothetical protein